MPLHAQAELWLRELIQQPEYQNGSLLPDEVSLAGRLAISRSTLRDAIKRLVSEGLLERKAGVGTRVKENIKIHSEVGEWHSFSSEMERRGIKVETYSIQVQRVPASGEVARSLRLDPLTEVLQLDRLRGWQREPVIHFCSYLHPRVNLTEEDDFKQPLYTLIKKCSGILPVRSEEKLTAIGAPALLAAQLKIRKGSPVLRRERTVYDTGNRPMEYALVHCRSDRFALTLNLKKNES